ncbi:unnamed protein product [Spirodela intermedia]|uniref:RIN4 pathogenic type III effector avirulence factor Avr cleavage site domain-containing protein n=1 Tax=Spirodela intermedia TaxID=51605 RepID=A0A7I8JLP8_SPIIN|nr:unnamed protein product [Spirodela intermedia]CAA6670701.1 unnamed protein product [Spirodela intermedia]
MASRKGSPLPKFGDWDVNNPASAEGFTMIFNKVRDEKKTGGGAVVLGSPTKDAQAYGAPKPARIWCCFIKASPSRS